MVIILDKPVSLGDISTESFPHCYITNFYVNGPAVMVQISYEFGTMKEPTAENQSGWNPCPAFLLNKQFQLIGNQLAPFFSTMGNSGDSLWDEVETAIYKEIQKQDPRTAGTLGVGFEQKTTDSTASTSVGPDSTAGADSTETASTSSDNTSAVPSAT